MFAIRRRLYPVLEHTLLAAGAFRAAKRDMRRSSPRIIFVCSGNICRSPYAEVLARRCGLSAVSCGTRAQSGSPAHPPAIAEAARRGIELKDHRSVRWEDVSLRSEDLILAMQIRHAVTVVPRALKNQCTVWLFSSLLPRFAPIWDPYGRSEEAYGEVFDLIDTGVRQLARLADAAFSDAPAPPSRSCSRRDADCGGGEV